MSLMIPDSSRLVPLTEEVFTKLLALAGERQRLSGVIQRFDWHGDYRKSLRHVHPEDDETAAEIVQRRDRNLAHLYCLTTPKLEYQPGEWYLSYCSHPALDQLYRDTVGGSDMPMDADLVPTTGGFIPEMFVMEWGEGCCGRTLIDRGTMIPFLPPDTPVQTKVAPVWDEALTHRAIKALYEKLREPEERYERFTNILHCLSFPEFILLPGDGRLSALADATRHQVNGNSPLTLLEREGVIWMDLGENQWLHELFDPSNTAPLKRYLATTSDILKCRVPDPSEGRIFCWQRYV